jgi:hypothetical protein
MELHTIDKQEPTEELMGRKGQTVEEESKKHFPKTAWGLRDLFSTGKSDGIFGGDEAIRCSLLHLLLGDGGTNPAGGRSFGHGVLVG